MSTGLMDQTGGVGLKEHFCHSSGTGIESLMFFGAVPKAGGRGNPPLPVGDGFHPIPHMWWNK